MSRHKNDFTKLEIEIRREKNLKNSFRKSVEILAEDEMKNEYSQR